MKNILILFLLTATPHFAFCQLKIDKIKNTDFSTQENNIVEAFTKFYRSKTDLVKNRNPMYIEYSRHYTTSDADSAFARLNINGKDVEFKKPDNDNFAYVSLNQKYKLKSRSISSKTMLTLYYGKIRKSVILFSKSFSG